MSRGQSSPPSGKFVNKVPILLGSNHDEGTMFNVLPKNITWGDVEALANVTYGAFASRILAQVRGQCKANLSNSCSTLLVSINHPGGQFRLSKGTSRSTARPAEQPSGLQSQECPPMRKPVVLRGYVFLTLDSYFFAHKPDHAVPGSGCLGVCHR